MDKLKEVSKRRRKYCSKNKNKIEYLKGTNYEITKRQGNFYTVPGHEILLSLEKIVH